MSKSGAAVMEPDQSGLPDDGSAEQCKEKRFQKEEKGGAKVGDDLAPGEAESAAVLEDGARKKQRELREPSQLRQLHRQQNPSRSETSVDAARDDTVSLGTSQMPAEGLWVEAGQDSQDYPWLCADVFQQVVEAIEGDIPCKVTALQMWPILPMGDYHSGMVYRVVIHYTTDADRTLKGSTEIRSVVVKTLPMHAGNRCWVETEETLQKEIRLYTETFPYMMELYRESLDRDAHPFHPLVYPVSELNLLVLEDLNNLGYSCPTRVSQMTTQQVLESLLQLARFHALSVVTLQKKPDLMTFAKERILVQENEAAVTAYLSRLISAIVTKMRSEGRNERHCHLLEGFAQHLFSQLRDTLANLDFFCVLTHGDLWLGNVMLRERRGGSVGQARFIDFANARWAPAFCDVLYFVFTSASQDALRSGIPVFVNAYLAELRLSLVRLGVAAHTIPSWADLVQQYAHCKWYAPYAMITVLPLVAAPSLDRHMRPHPLDDPVAAQRGGQSDPTLAPSDTGLVAAQPTSSLGLEQQRSQQENPSEIEQKLLVPLVVVVEAARDPDPPSESRWSLEPAGSTVVQAAGALAPAATPQLLPQRLAAAVDSPAFVKLYSRAVALLEAEDLGFIPPNMAGQ